MDSVLYFLVEGKGMFCTILIKFYFKLLFHLKIFIVI